MTKLTFKDFVDAETVAVRSRSALASFGIRPEDKEKLQNAVYILAVVRQAASKYLCDPGAGTREKREALETMNAKLFT